MAKPSWSPPTYQFPSSDLDRAQVLLATLGTCWANIYAAQDQLLSYTLATAQIAGQTQLDVLELIASLSRYTVPIWHRCNWYCLTIRQSQLNSAATSLASFNGAYDYDGTLQFDVPPASSLNAFPLPPKLTGVPKIMNRLTSPSIVLTDSLDYIVDPTNGALVFLANPFNNPLWASCPVWTDGAITDYEISMWLFRGEFDYGLIYQQFAYVLGIQLASSKGYRDLTNALFDALVGGTAGLQVAQVLQAVTGTQLVQEMQETVQYTRYDNAGLLIITDQHVYRFPSNVTALVTEGQVVTAGQPLTDTLRITELNQGQIPAGLQALAMGQGFLATCFYGDLVFENTLVPLEVSTDSAGYTFVKFALGGFPADVCRFFDEIQERGIQQLQQYVENACELPPRIGTLAHMLDTRTVKVGEPGPSNLPTAINPLQFLIQNVLRNNAFVVQIKVAGMGADAIGLYNVRHLRKLLPPATAMILVLEFSPQSEHITPDLISENVGNFSAATMPPDIVTADLVNAGGFTVRTVAGACQ